MTTKTADTIHPQHSGGGRAAWGVPRPVAHVHVRAAQARACGSGPCDSGAARGSGDASGQVVIDDFGDAQYYGEIRM